MRRPRHHGACAERQADRRRRALAEAKEALGGFHLIECKDLDEAVAIAQRIPTFSAGGVVEVRTGPAARSVTIVVRDCADRRSDRRMGNGPSRSSVVVLILLVPGGSEAGDRVVVRACRRSIFAADRRAFRARYTSMASIAACASLWLKNTSLSMRRPLVS
jgi:hypothetical protein